MSVRVLLVLSLALSLILVALHASARSLPQGHAGPVHQGDNKKGLTTTTAADQPAQSVSTSTLTAVYTKPHKVVTKPVDAPTNVVAALHEVAKKVGKWKKPFKVATGKWKAKRAVGAANGASMKVAAPREDVMEAQKKIWKRSANADGAVAPAVQRKAEPAPLKKVWKRWQSKGKDGKKAVIKPHHAGQKFVSKTTSTPASSTKKSWKSGSKH